MKLFIALAALLATAVAAPMDGRITNGEVARVGQFPYQVGLSIQMDKAASWCGGTLISNRWVLTAAHCTDSADFVTVYVGATKIREEEPGQQVIYVEKKNIIVHENWDASLVVNDISLIKLPAALQFSDRVQAASLPKKQNGRYSTYENQQAFASGWGLDSDKANAVSPILRYVEMPIMKASTCNRYWAGMITENTICMSTKGGKSVCSGDSGGPLVHKDGDVNTLIGSTSFGLGLGCERGYPAVFTRTSAYLDWIEKHTNLSTQ